MLTTFNPNSSATSPKFSVKMKKILLAATISLTCFNPTSALAQYNYEVQQLYQLRQNYQIQAKNLDTEMGLYMLSHPKPSAAFIASGLGLAAVLEENLDPNTKAFFVGLGLVGANYCLDSNNAYYCGQVAGNLTGYMVRINNYKQEINAINQKINYLQQ
jgi:hypothetical protein